MSELVLNGGVVDDDVDGGGVGKAEGKGHGERKSRGCYALASGQREGSGGRIRRTPPVLGSASCYAEMSS